MTPKALVPVSKRALVQRINRKLAAEDKILRASVGAQAADLGAYYTIDTNRNAITGKSIDLETYGRKIGALADFEKLVG